MKVESLAITSHEQWLKMRQEDVTASDVACLFGNDAHPYKTVRALYEEKKGNFRNEIDTEVLRRGRIYEPIAANLIGEHKPEWTLWKADQYWRAPEIGLGATPDYIVECPERGRGVLQIKTVGSLIAAQKWADDVPPPWIVLQTTVEFMLGRAALGIKWAAVGVMIIDQFRVPDPIIIDIPVHKGVEDKIVSLTEGFWQAFNANEEPPMDFSRDGDLVFALHSTGDPDLPVLDLSQDNRLVELLQRRDLLGSLSSEVDKRKKQIDVEIKDKLGEHEVAKGPDGRSISWKTRKAYTANVKATRVLRVGKPEVDLSAEERLVEVLNASRGADGHIDASVAARAILASEEAV